MKKTKRDFYNLLFGFMIGSFFMTPNTPANIFFTFLVNTILLGIYIIYYVKSKE